MSVRAIRIGSSSPPRRRTRPGCCWTRPLSGLSPSPTLRVGPATTICPPLPPSSSLAARRRMAPHDDPTSADARALGEAIDPKTAQAFFERHFVPQRPLSETGFVTGYYEPELRGSRKHSPRFPVLVYARPDDLISTVPDSATGPGSTIASRGSEPRLTGSCRITRAPRSMPGRWPIEGVSFSMSKIRWRCSTCRCKAQLLCTYTKGR